MKKLIILFLILGILLIGCKSYTQTSNLPSSQNSPAIGSGCSVSEAENQETKIKYVGVEVAL